MIEFTRHVFATLTYSREQTSQDRWLTISKDFNRYIQRFSRLHNIRINYLRVVEEHKDGYPHIHILIQFPDARIRILSSKYFDQDLYAKWRLLWKHGHTDYQRPRSRNLGTLSYILKYLIKNTTAKTIWKKIFVLPATAELLAQPPSMKDLPTNVPNMDAHASIKSLSENPTHAHGVKLCTWSRDFDWKPFFTARNK